MGNTTNNYDCGHTLPDKYYIRIDGTRNIRLCKYCFKKAAQQVAVLITGKLLED